MSEISKSQETLDKEKRIQELRKQIKKRNSTLKSLKTRYRNTELEIQETERRMYTEGSRRMEEYHRKREGIKQKLEEAIANTELPKKLREQLHDVKDVLFVEDSGLGQSEFGAEESPEEEEAFPFGDDDVGASWGEHAGFGGDPFGGGPFAGGPFRAGFQEGESAPFSGEEAEPGGPNTLDKREIRKIYLRLSVKFHPDKAEDEATAKRYHDLMVQINQAYKQFDAHRLLEIERQHSGLPDVLASDQPVSVAVLDEEIERLELELQSIEQQIDRTSMELKELRSSDSGQLLSQQKRRQKEGGDLIDNMVVRMENEIEEIQEIEAYIEKSIRRKKLHPELQHVISNNFFLEMLRKVRDNAPGEEAPRQESTDQRKKPPKPAFKNGASVRLRGSLEIPFSDITLKGATGKLVELYISDEGVSYDMMLDKASMQRIPGQLMQEWVDSTLFSWEFNPTFEIDQSELEEAPEVSTLAEDEHYIRYLYYTHRYGHAPDVLEVLQHVLLDPVAQQRRLTEHQLWQRFFKKELEYPFYVQYCSSFGDKTSNFSYKVFEVYFDPDRNEFVAHVQGPKRKQRNQLLKFELDPIPKRFDWLNAFRAWAMGGMSAQMK
jgi:hypothetical protein